MCDGVGSSPIPRRVLKWWPRTVFEEALYGFLWTRRTDSPSTGEVQVKRPFRHIPLPNYIYRVLLFSVCSSGGSSYSSAGALLGINIDTYHTFPQGGEDEFFDSNVLFSKNILYWNSLPILTSGDGIDNT